MIAKTKDRVYCLKDLNSERILNENKVVIANKERFDMHFVW
jgi:hypothetical protein